MTNNLFVQDADTHNKIFPLERELLEDCGSIVEIRDYLFNIPNAVVRSPTVAITIQSLEADATATELGPYGADAADSEALKVRKDLPRPTQSRRNLYALRPGLHVAGVLLGPIPCDCDRGEGGGLHSTHSDDASSLCRRPIPYQRRSPGGPATQHPSVQEVLGDPTGPVGVMALLVAKVDPDIIQIRVLWRSDKMFRYLHLSAKPIMKDFASRMLRADYTLAPSQLVPVR